MKRDKKRQSSRTTRLGVIVGVVALVGAGGWVAGTRMESPADAAAAHQPPEAGPVTVPVEQRALTATVVAQGSLEYGSPRSLTLAGTVGASEGDGEGDAAVQRVTKAPTRGSVLKEGSVLMQVSGRPVMVLRGSVPMYRTIGPGTSGDDVRQLQNALNRLGFTTGGVTGTYGQGTASAVSRWYRSRGYTAQEPSTADRQELGQLESAVSDAQLALLTAQGSGEGTRGEQGDGESVPESDEARALQIKSAKKQLELANSALSAFKSGYGTKVPAGEVIFLPELPVRVDKTKVRAGDAPDGEVATVTSSDVVVEAVVPGTDAGSLRKGMAVQVTTPDGREAKGVLSEIGGSGAGPEGSAGNAGTGGEAEGAGGSGGGASAPVPLRITIPKPGPLADAGAGGAATVTIKVGDSDGKVLAVPVAAVQTSVGGQARVRVQRGKQVVRVEVDLGISADGLVAVKSEGSALKEGDLVVVGL
ncbi:peptidoglycan-binding protein [Streptomyces sp. GESEQ-4]|uniref:peptidoglycan-binding protein n=1 Tax=Streptomyces sp. GESEQ-4 TaxID=2812655 RepID=UPI0027DDA165|nr:peptidoglycan-binding protein [Streptomyces sp. GESEQ-4]